MAHSNDIKPAIAFAAAQEFAGTNADKILIGHAAIAAFTEIIFDSGKRTAAIGDPQTTICGRVPSPGGITFSASAICVLRSSSVDCSPGRAASTSALTNSGRLTSGS